MSIKVLLGRLRRSGIYPLGVGLAVIMGLLGAPRDASAQGSTWVGANLARSVETARWRWGSLRANGSLNVNNAGYDSDVYYGYLESPVPDLTLSVGVPVQLLWPVSKKLLIDVFESPEYLYFRETKKERGWNNTLTGSMHWALKKLYVKAGTDYRNVRQRLSPELDVIVRQKMDRYTGTLLAQTSRKTSLAFLYDRSQFRYGGSEFEGTPLAQTLNRTENRYDAILYVEPSAKVRSFLDGQYGSYVFSEIGSDFKNAHSYAVFGGLDFVPSAGEARALEPVQGHIGLGYKKLDVLDPAFTDGSGFVGAVNVSSGIIKRVVGRAFFLRDFQFSFRADTAYYASTTYGGGMTYVLSRHASLSYDFSLFSGSYPQPGSTGAGGAAAIRFANHQLEWHIRVTRDLRISALGALSRRTLMEDHSVRNRGFIGFSLIYGTPAAPIASPASSLVR